jgi:hypothetical protein
MPTLPFFDLWLSVSANWALPTQLLQIWLNFVDTIDVLTFG